MIFKAAEHSEWPHSNQVQTRKWIFRDHHHQDLNPGLGLFLSKANFVLGQPSSGKSTLVSALLHKALSDDQKDAQRTDFAIGYDFADVRDEADESKYSRLQATSNSMLRVH